MGNVVALQGADPDGMPVNVDLVEQLRAALGMAESGQLQSYAGVGFTVDGLIMRTWAPNHGNAYEFLGALASMQARFIEHRPDVLT